MPSKALSLDVGKEEAGKYRPAIHECIAEIDRILKRMKRKDVEIERSQKRTRAMLTELKALR
jgi:hypothetical protein